MTAYDEQLLAALILAGGNLAEMAAGEGKTLVVTKSVDDPNPDIGQTINFTLTIRHPLQSTAIAYDVIAQDTLPLRNFLSGLHSMPRIVCIFGFHWSKCFGF